MNKMKRIFSLVLVLTMVLGSFGSVFAAAEEAKEVEKAEEVLTAVPKDVIGTEYEKAVSRLVAFGIVEGYKDGTYKPENDVTRAEFAKLLVESLGLGSAANAAVGKTNFSDVPATHWASGYINVASGQGLIKGYPNGTFEPSRQVSYAEALTMLVRALGYKDEFLGVKGANWAEAYTAKAAQVGISTGVRFTPNTFAQRGTVAILVNNALDSKIIKQTKFGSATEWEEQMITLLEEYLDIKKLEEVVVVGTPKVDKIEKDQIRVEFEKDIYYTEAVREYDKNKKYYKGDEETFDLARSVEPDAIGQRLGESLNIYLNDKDDVVYFEESDRPFKVLYDVIDGTEHDSYKKYQIELKNADRSYDVQEEGKDINAAVFYIDNKIVKDYEEFYDIAYKLSDAGNGKDLFAKIVLNRRGNIKLVDAHEWDGDIGVVIKADKDEITYFVDDEDDEKKIKVKDYDKMTIFDEKGNVLDIEDVKKDDVIYLNDKDSKGDDLEEASSKDEVAYVLVVRNKIEGKLESYRTGSKDNVIDVEIDGKKYDIIDGSVTTVSIDNDATIEIADLATSDLDDLSADNAEVTVLLDAAGDVRHIRGGIESSSGNMYGIVTGVDKKYGDVYVKVLNYDEDTVEYELDLDDVYGYDVKDEKELANETKVDDAQTNKGKGVARGDIVRYKVNSKGDIKEIQLLAYYDGTDFKKAEKDNNTKYNGIVALADNTSDIGSKSIRLADKTYETVKDDVKVFNYTPAFAKDGKTLVDPADAEFVEWKDIAGKSVRNDVKVLLGKDKNRGTAELVVFLSNFEEIGDDAYVGYVTSMRKVDGDGYADIVYPGSDKEVRMELSNSSDYEPAEGDGFRRRNIALFTETSNGKVKYASDHAELEAITGKVTNITGRYITLELVGKDTVDTRKVRVDSDTIYYKKGKVQSFSDISENDYIRVGLKEGVVGVVKKYELTTKELEEGKEEAGLFKRDFAIDAGYEWGGEAASKPGDKEEGTVTYINNADNTPVKDNKVTLAYGDTLDLTAKFQNGDKKVTIKSADTPVSLYVDGVATALTKNVLTDTDLVVAANQEITFGNDIKSTAAINSIGTHVLNISIKAGDIEVEDTIEVVVVAAQADKDDVNAIKNSADLKVTFAASEDKDNVKSNITLVEPTDKKGVTITWKSDNDAVTISGTTGTVARPDYGDGDVDVTITAELSKNGVTDKKEFVITVLEKDPSNEDALKEIIKTLKLVDANGDDLDLTNVKDGVIEAVVDVDADKFAGATATVIIEASSRLAVVAINSPANEKATVTATNQDAVVDLTIKVEVNNVHGDTTAKDQTKVITITVPKAD